MSFWDKLAIKEKKMYSNLTLAFSSFFHPACCPRLASFLLFWVKFKRWFDICQAEKGRLVKLFFEWETFGNSEMYSGEITQNFGLLSNIRFILKNHSKSLILQHFATKSSKKWKILVLGRKMKWDFFWLTSNNVNSKWTEWTCCSIVFPP